MVRSSPLLIFVLSELSQVSQTVNILYRIETDLYKFKFFKTTYVIGMICFLAFI